MRLLGHLTLVAASRSVRKNPGSTTVTLIPNFSTSSTTASERPSTANLLAPYALQCFRPTTPATELMLMMWPERCLRMTGSAARIMYNTHAPEVGRELAFDVLCIQFLEAAEQAVCLSLEKTRRRQ